MPLKGVKSNPLTTPAKTGPRQARPAPGGASSRRMTSPATSRRDTDASTTRQPPATRQPQLGARRHTPAQDAKARAREATPDADDSASDDDMPYDDDDEELTGSDSEFEGSTRSQAPSDADVLDPSLLWFASRGTQCRTPDVATAPSNGISISFGTFETDTSADPHTEVFSVPIADFNARASQNVEDSDSSDDEARKGGITFHSPPKRGMVMMRVGGNRYGFSSDTRLRPEPIVPKFGRKTAEKSTQTTDRRINARTRFAKEDAIASPPAPEPTGPTLASQQKSKPPRGGAKGSKAGKPGDAKGKADGRRGSVRGAGKGEKRKSVTGGGQSKDDDDASNELGASIDEAQRRKSSAAQAGGETPAQGSSPAEPSAASPAFNSTRATASRKGARPSRFGMSTRGRSRPSGSVVEKPAPKDPSEDYEWIDGIGNVPRRHPYYEQMRAVKPKVRPSSANVDAAMNQPTDEVPQSSTGGPSRGRRRERGGDDSANNGGDGEDFNGMSMMSTTDEDGNPNRRLSSSRGSVTNQDSFLPQPSFTGTGSRRQSGPGSLMTPDSFTSGSQGVIPPNALRNAAVAGLVPVNPFLVEERRLPEIRDRHVKRAAIPISESNFNPTGGGITARVQNSNPWAGANFTYDPRKLMSKDANAAAAASPISGGAPTPATARPGASSTHVATKPTAFSRPPAYQRPLPALQHPDEIIEGNPSGGAGSSASSPAGPPAGRKTDKAATEATAADKAADTGAAAKADKEAKADTVKTAKQQLLDREREFAKMFPDWLANDDRLRAPQRATGGTRSGRR